MQVLELVEYNGQSADSYGFDKEDGFEVKSAEADDDALADEFDDEADF